MLWVYQACLIPLFTLMFWLVWPVLRPGNRGPRNGDAKPIGATPPDAGQSDQDPAVSLLSSYSRSF